MTCFRRWPRYQVSSSWVIRIAEEQKSRKYPRLHYHTDLQILPMSSALVVGKSSKKKKRNNIQAKERDQKVLSFHYIFIKHIGRNNEQG